MWLTRLGLWPVRVVWFLLPVATAVAFGDLLDSHERAVSLVAEIGLWSGWCVGLIALLAPSAVSLTTIRMLAPGGLGALILATIAADNVDWGPSLIAAYGAVLVALLVVFAPWTGDQLVNGSSYGPERRMALRPPASLLLGPIELTWLAVFLGAISGPLLLASGRWISGVLLLLLGLPIVYLGCRALHQLARRWIVFVPAGFVLHDYFGLAEALLMQRRQIEHLGPAPLDKGELLDLSGGAAGLALMVELKEETPLALRARRDIHTFAAQRLVFTPTLPGALLQEARVRGIRIS